MKVRSSGVNDFASHLVALFLLFSSITLGCDGTNGMMSKKGIEGVLKEHTDDLLFIPGVVGVAQGICDGEPCIKVLVVEKTPEVKEKIPNWLGGYRVEVQETGEIKAQPK